jgi:hypothetical protein
MQLGIHLEKWCHTYLQLPPKTSGTIFIFVGYVFLKLPLRCWLRLQKQTIYVLTYTRNWLLQQPKLPYYENLCLLSLTIETQILVLVTQLGSPITLANLKLIASIGSPEPTSQWQLVEVPGSWTG